MRVVIGIVSTVKLAVRGMLSVESAVGRMAALTAGEGGEEGEKGYES